MLYNTSHIHPFRLYMVPICSSGPPLNIYELSYSNIHSDIFSSVSCPQTLQHAVGGIKLRTPPISGRPALTLEPQLPSTFKTQVWKIVVKKVTQFICLDNKYSMYCSPFSSVIIFTFNPKSSAVRKPNVFNTKCKQDKFLHHWRAIFLAVSNFLNLKTVVLPKNRP